MEKETRQTKNANPSKPKKKINGWMIAFLVLLGTVLGSFVFLGTRVFDQREPNYKESPTLVEREGKPVVTINSNKQQINDLIDFFLTEYQKDSDIKYEFALENEAMLTGEFDVLSFPVRFYLYFEPYVMDDGNVQLRAKSLSVGTLGLPIKQIMQMAKRSYKFPEFIEVNPEDETILIRLDQFRMQNGLFIKANKINLVDDEIQVSLYLPKDESDNKKETDSSKNAKEENDSSTKE